MHHPLPQCSLFLLHQPQTPQPQLFPSLTPPLFLSITSFQYLRQPLPLPRSPCLPLFSFCNLSPCSLPLILSLPRVPFASFSAPSLDTSYSAFIKGIKGTSDPKMSQGRACMVRATLLLPFVLRRTWAKVARRDPEVVGGKSLALGGIPTQREDRTQARARRVR